MEDGGVAHGQAVDENGGSFQTGPSLWGSESATVKAQGQLADGATESWAIPSKQLFADDNARLVRAEAEVG